MKEELRIERLGAMVGVPAPAGLDPETLTRLDTDRIRASRQHDGSWSFNYSIIKLDAPELDARLTLWWEAMAQAVAPLQVRSVDITFKRPEGGARITGNAELALTEFARTCVELLGQVGPDRDVLISLFWSSLTRTQECLDDWHIELSPVRDAVDAAADNLISTLEPWLMGLDRLIINLDYVVVQGAGEGASDTDGSLISQERS